MAMVMQTDSTVMQPQLPLSLDPKDDKPGFLSVLCVSEDPLFRDRICRNLERGGSIFIEIAVTADDALHLMAYLFFDAVVTDCVTWRGKEHGFLQAMREQGIRIPFVYFIKTPVTRIPKEAARFNRVRSVPWNGHPDTWQFDNLLRCIHELTDGRTGDRSPGTSA